MLRYARYRSITEEVDIDYVNGDRILGGWAFRPKGIPLEVMPHV